MYTSRIGIVASHLLDDPRGHVRALSSNAAHGGGANSRVTLVGSCIMDVQAWVGDHASESRQSSGSSTGRVTFSPGGVCMNIARALKWLERLHGDTVSPDVCLVSAVGNDGSGQNMLALCSSEGICTASVLVVQEGRTATVVVLFNSQGDAIQSVVDVSILERYLTPDTALKALQKENGKGICVVDGDLHRDVIESVCQEAALRGCQVVFDPATVSKAPKCIHALKNIYLLTPNIYELDEIARALRDMQGHHDIRVHTNYSPLLFVRARACVELVLKRGVKYLLLTAGHMGAALYQMEDDCTIHVEYCPPIPTDSIASVNGAGDSLVAGFLYALMLGKNQRESLAFGMASAWEALQTKSNVPEHYGGSSASRFKRHVAAVLRGTQSLTLCCGCCCSTCCSAININE